MGRNILFIANLRYSFSMTVLKRIIAIIAIIIAAAPALVAQETYRYEVGGGVGVSGYLGDANRGNMLKSLGWSAGGIFRYVIDRRWSLKANLFVVGISGNSEGTVYPGGAIYDFSSTLYDFGAQMEFNFFNFGIGSKYMNLKRITPYLTVGLGGALATPDVGGTAFSVVLPMGVGVKYKLKERLNLGLEFTMRKSFGDGLDGLSDLNGIKHSFAKNTDWYSVLMVSITYEFGKRCKVCHYVD